MGARQVHWLRVLLIGLAANLDNLGVGVAYGARRIRVPTLPNALIAATAYAATWTSVVAGAFIARLLPPAVANTVGAVLLMAVGVWVILTHWLRRPQPAAATAEAAPATVLQVFNAPESADRDRSGSISVPESLLLGVALSINCLTNGFSAGLIGLGAHATALVTALFSYLTLWGGALLGIRCAAAWLGERATVLAGCLLILIGIHQLL